MVGLHFRKKDSSGQQVRNVTTGLVKLCIKREMNTIKRQGAIFNKLWDFGRSHRQHKSHVYLSYDYKEKLLNISCLG